MTPTPHDLERMLRAARPAPRADFVDELERALLPPPRERAIRPRLRFAIVGTAFAAVLAAVVVGMGVAGLLPFSSSGHGAQAKQRCRPVVVERRERVPHFETDRRGNIRVRYTRELVPRTVMRCR